ncbi:hypothetical protein O6H91_11G081900 [Diphasiastrum complanatum]|nr:hypothetical protein O6H91_11G081900 [Diphasiastrum complanatum]
MWVTSISPLKLQKHGTIIGKDKNWKDQGKGKDGAKDWVERAPKRKYAKLEDKNLSLISDDGNTCYISLQGCIVHAISGAFGSAKKWAKRYPIKVEHKTRTLFLGSTICLLYFETSWEKEAWCEALRAATRMERNDNKWYIDLKKEFKAYVVGIKDQYPSLSGTSQTCFLSQKSLDQNAETGSPRQRMSLLRRVLKKTLKVGNRDRRYSEEQEESSTTKVPSNGQCQEVLALDKKMDEGMILHYSFGDTFGTSITADETKFTAKTKETTNMYVSEKKTSAHGNDEISSMLPPTRGFPSIDQRGETGKAVDEGVLGWNILFSRLFFDLAHSTTIVASLQKRIQKLLSNVPTPSYISGVSCTHLDLGKVPPLLERLKVLPVDANGVWGFEANVYYCGGAILTIETRLDVRESTAQEKVVNLGLESNLAGAATADFLNEGLQTVDRDIQVARELEDNPRHEVEEAKEFLANNEDGLQESKGSGRKRWMQSSSLRWKTVLSCVADQVSQVPITLSVRTLSLKGTLQVRMKAPPSDRIWFGFLSMPELELLSEPSIGDRKISTGPVVSFIADRLKMLLRETMVFPNFEDVYVPWMMSEKDDWLEQSLVPLPWTMPESRESMFIQQKLQRVSELSITNECLKTTNVCGNLQRLQRVSELSITNEGQHGTDVCSNLSFLQIDRETDDEHKSSHSGVCTLSPNVAGYSMVDSDGVSPHLQTERYLDPSEERDASGRESNRDLRQQQAPFFNENCDRISSAFEENSEHKKKRSSRYVRVLNLGKKMSGKLQDNRPQ